MQHRYVLLSVVVLGMIITVGLSGCAKESAESESSQPAAALPASVFLNSAAASPVPVAELRATAKEGDLVTLRGVVGGRKLPLVRQRAIMTVVDPSVPNRCVEEADPDHCATPWDYCCTAPEQINGEIATVQLVDEQGQVLKGDLAASGRLKPLSTVVVQGTVGPRPDESVFVVNATGVYVESTP